MGIIQEFKDFAMRGNVVDMAVGIIIGAEFGKIVNSMVDNIIMPPLGYLIGGVNFKDLSLKLEAPAIPGATEARIVEIGWGSFLQTALNFLIIAFAIFMVIKLMNAIKKRFEADKAAEPAAPPADIQLLTEIRDALKNR
jgi:large conductance mechanosensitive channel